MKNIKIVSTYIIKSGLVKMLEKLIEKINNGENLFYIEIESNIEGILTATFEVQEIEDLIQYNTSGKISKSIEPSPKKLLENKIKPNT